VLLASLRRAGPAWGAYIDEYIERVRPRLVITYVDNNPAFYGVSCRHPGLKTVFVQNGYRGYYVDVFEHLASSTMPHHAFRVDHMLTFGEAIGREFSKYLRGEVIPIGSLRSNHFGRRDRPVPSGIAFVSQYSAQGTRVGSQAFTQDEFCRAPDAAILSFLRRYADERGKVLTVITRSRTAPELEAEQRYFRKLAGDQVAFAPAQESGASYYAVDAAEVVVANTSTLGLEAAARGVKTAFFAIHREIYSQRDPLLVWDRGLTWPERYPDDGPFWTYRNDPAAFRRILDHLFEIDAAEWQRELARARYDEVITSDPGNAKLRGLLERILDSA
jgi:surface carbohydrate biosynthesis protein